MIALRHAVIWAAVAAAGLGVVGCRSVPKAAPASFASVRIAGHSAEQIRGATVVVFQQAGYALAPAPRGELVFEKSGSRWDRFAYGSWLDEGPVWVRARVLMMPLTEGEYRLQCQAYKVRNRGDPLGESEVRLKRKASPPYQALLDEVARQLNR